MEKTKDYARNTAKIFEQECIDKITKYGVPTMIMRLTVPAVTHNVYFERKLSISQEYDVNAIQLTLGTASQDSGENFANGDFALSAESGTVQIYDQNWYNSEDIVPDQVTPASDSTPFADSGTGVAGTSNEYSRRYHKHPLQVTTSLQGKGTSIGNICSPNTYVRSDHQHLIQTPDSIQPADKSDGSYSTVDFYA
ncbi:MAG: hypothetical protein EZS28_005662 [Streblomastix strix]|uniref:Uncharacterized protein n=1 Tax=Streblomastix strix TaxID=222440 RepID=A0A5J4WUT6_9EUKA|nr:MAG: hypothetical protein EZS28_005662 [Streblomastix strix]